ncbi:MAG: hypothetical protein ACOX0U_01035 [Oscillospiraceae bacterium]|jgi:hypothetical protein
MKTHRLRMRYLVLLLFLLFSLAGCKEKTAKSIPQVNQDLTENKSFAVSTQYSGENTIVKGNVYVQDYGDQVVVTLLAAVVITQTDWGGVAFHIPKGWHLTKALSSYPDGSDVQRTQQAAVWTAADSASDWGSFVEIGRNKNQIPTSGGTGSVVLEMQPDDIRHRDDTCTILVSVGSGIRNGIPVAGTHSTRVDVAFSPAN